MSFTHIKSQSKGKPGKFPFSITGFKVFHGYLIAPFFKAVFVGIVYFSHSNQGGGGSQGGKPGVLVISAYQKPYTKALGKDGILVCHEQSLMHRHDTEKADN